MGRRPFDVVLWGCTGFTGRLVAKYFATRVAKRQPGLRWALAGRSEEKLVSLSTDCAHPEGNVPFLVASASDQAEVDKVAASTKVILSTAGPFAQHGAPVIDACIRNGCDYVDINGETGWHRQMIDTYDDAARDAGVVLIPSSGFDSIPSDLGSAWMTQRIFDASGLPTRRVSCYASLRGSFSGGTVASGINSELTHGTALSDPFLLGGQPYSFSGITDDEHDDLLEPVYDPLIGSYTAPFGMSTINTRIVRRSVGLLEEDDPGCHSERYSPDFCYRECMTAPDEATAAKMARAAAAPASKLAEMVASGRLPSPGDGPDEATRASSWFDFKFVAEADGPAGASGTLSYKLCGTISGGDPGYDETAKMVSETAVLLAMSDREELPASARRAGFLTPSTALGSLLQERLHTEGIRFEEAPLPEGVLSADAPKF